MKSSEVTFELPFLAINIFREFRLTNQLGAPPTATAIYTSGANDDPIQKLELGCKRTLKHEDGTSVTSIVHDCEALAGSIVWEEISNDTMGARMVAGECNPVFGIKLDQLANTTKVTLRYFYDTIMEVKATKFCCCTSKQTKELNHFETINFFSDVNGKHLSEMWEKELLRRGYKMMGKPKV